MTQRMEKSFVNVDTHDEVEMHHFQQRVLELLVEGEQSAEEKKYLERIQVLEGASSCHGQDLRDWRDKE